jgi:hypothetical protein
MQTRFHAPAIVPTNHGGEPLPPDITLRSGAIGVLLLLDLVRSVCTLSLHSGSVRTMVARPMRTDFRRGREPFRSCRRCSITRSPGFPFPPLALVPNETPAAIPAGVSPCVSGSAPVHAV